MGRRNKKLAKLQQSKQAREFLQHKEKAVSFLRLTPEEKRVEIAHTCVIILSNPELQYCKLESILELCNDYDEHIQSLAISSLCAVFIDILPGYRIQDHEEEGIVLSKEVKAVRIFETSLLKYYESYLSILMGKYNFGSVQCICRLLEKLLHFNYREKLADYAINAICELPDVVVPAIRVALLSNELELRYHVVKAIEKFVKTSSYKIVPSKIIEMLAEINFSMIQVEDLPQKRQRDHEDNEKKKEVQMVIPS